MIFCVSKDASVELNYVEGFQSSRVKSNRNKSNNMLASAIKNFGMTGQKKQKEKLTNITQSTLKNKNKDSSKSKLSKLGKPGARDAFKDVMNEVDKIDLEAISLNGFTNTIKQYNDNFNNRLEHARKKNNNNDMEVAMAQWDVLKDEFRKLFLFSDYV